MTTDKLRIAVLPDHGYVAWKIEPEPTWGFKLSVWCDRYDGARFVVIATFAAYQARDFYGMLAHLVNRALSNFPEVLLKHQALLAADIEQSEADYRRYSAVS